MKKQIIPGILAVIVIAVAVVFIQRASREDLNKDAQNSQKDPMSIRGIVVRTEADRLFFRTNDGERVAVVGNFSPIIKQEKQKDGSIRNAPAQMSDLTANSSVVVYYFSEPVNGTYQAERIQKVD